MRRVQPADAWFASLVMASIAASAYFVSTDGDLGFHLATGREVLDSGRIPATNVLSFTQPDHPWLLHQWLPATLFELLWRAGSIGAVTAAKAGLVAVTWGLLYVAARGFGATPALSALACLLSAAAASFRFEARPLLFSYLALSALLVALGALWRAAAAGRSTRGALLGCAAIAAAACHFHAGALDLFIALGVVALGCLCEPPRARLLSTAPLQPFGAALALRVTGAALAAASLAALTLELYHPHGVRVLTVPLRMATDPYLASHLVEFRPPWAFPAIYLAGLWALLGLTAFTLATQAKRMHVAHVGLLLVFGGLALRHTRLAFGFAVVAAPLLAAAWTGSPLRARLLAAFGERAPRLGVWLVLGAALFVPLETWRKVEPGAGFAAPTWPLAHFGVMRGLALRGPAYVSDAWAGPMLGFFYPERRAFFDNRLEAYPPEFVTDVYQRIRYARPGWDALLDRHGVQIVLMRYTTAAERRFQDNRDNLRQRLASDPRWALIFFDDVGELFVRRDGDNAALARSLAIDGVDPDRLRFLRAPAAAAPALLAALERGPRSARMLGMGAVSVASSGQREIAGRLLQEARALSPDEPWLSQLGTLVARP